MTNQNLRNRTDTRGQGLFKTVSKTKKAKADKKPAPAAIQVGDHGRYQIKSGLLAGKFVARAFAKPPTEARGLIAEASGATEDAAIAALHDLIDARETGRIESRRQDAQTGISVPSIEEYAEAIGQVAMTRPQRAMLLALSLAEADGLSDAELARAAGYKSMVSTKRSLSRAARLIGEFLGLEIENATASEDYPPVAFRAEAQAEGDAVNLVLYPELRDAVKASL